MSEKNQQSLGPCVVGTYIDIEEDRKNPSYQNFYYKDSDDPRYGAKKFSIPTGSELHQFLKDVPFDSTLIIWTNSPRIATSKAGNKYLQYFPINIEIAS